MSFHWQFGVVESGASAGVAAPQSVRVADDDGTSNFITINANAPVFYQPVDAINPISAGTDFNYQHNTDLFVASGSGTVLTLKAYGGTQSGGGAITTHSWTLSEDSDSSGIGAVGNTTSSSQNYTNGTITISSSMNRNLYRAILAYEGSNSGGSDTTNFTINVKGS